MSITIPGQASSALHLCSSFTYWVITDPSQICAKYMMLGSMKDGMGLSAVKSYPTPCTLQEGCSRRRVA